jgi:hypothetical protein
VVLQWCYNSVTVVLQWRHHGVTVVSQWCYSFVAVVDEKTIMNSKDTPLSEVLTVVL